jgi:hypothetical protein
MKRSANFESRPQSRGSGKMSSPIMHKVCVDHASGCIKLYWKAGGLKVNSLFDLVPYWDCSRVEGLVFCPVAVVNVVVFLT